MRSTVDGVLSDALFLQGRYDEALELADESRSIAATDDLDSQPRSRVARARVLASRGPLDEALDLMGEALELVGPIDFTELKGYVHEVHGEVLVRAGRTEDAVAAVQRRLPSTRRKGTSCRPGARAPFWRGFGPHGALVDSARAGLPDVRAENEEDARFCSACGTALAEAEPSREQRKVVTVLFCDLVGSTALGESTDPEALRARMRRYFEDFASSSNGTVAPSRSSSETPSWPCSGSPSRTRTMRFARYVRRRRCAPR